MVKYRPLATSKTTDSAQFLSLGNQSRAIDQNRSTDAKKYAKKAVGVRVVQIFNPIYVDADAMNFQTLVQNLTGNCKSRSVRRSSDSSPKCSKSMQQLKPLQEQEDTVTTSAKSGYNSDYTNGLWRKKTSCNNNSEGGCFSDLDIWAGLMSDQQLPDITMLPQLFCTTNKDFQN